MATEPPPAREVERARVVAAAVAVGRAEVRGPDRRVLLALRAGQAPPQPRALPAVVGLALLVVRPPAEVTMRESLHTQLETTQKLAG